MCCLVGALPGPEEQPVPLWFGSGPKSLYFSMGKFCRVGRPNALNNLETQLSREIFLTSRSHPANERTCLFADAEAGEDAVEDILYIDAARDTAEGYGR